MRHWQFVPGGQEGVSPTFGSHAEDADRNRRLIVLTQYQSNPIETRSRKTTMKKTLLSAALIAAVATIGFVPKANAADGTITFSGKVLSSTCTVSNASSGVVAVTLPDVPATAFTGAGSTAGAKSFSLTLTGCPTTPSGVQVGAAFGGTSIDSAHAGTILNSTGATFSNVNVQMTDSAGTAINLSTNSNPVSATIDGSGAATLAYQARYYQPTAAAVTAGLVTASVTYTLTYN